MVYTEAGHSRQRIYHRRAFLALQQAALPPAELTFHAEQAGLVPEARVYLRRAADDANQVFQNRPALGFLTRALALTQPGEDIVLEPAQSETSCRNLRILLSFRV